MYGVGNRTTTERRLDGISNIDSTSLRYKTRKTQSERKRNSEKGTKRAGLTPSASRRARHASRVKLNLFLVVLDSPRRAGEGFGYSSCLSLF